LELLIQDLSHDGRGIARAGQKAVFVSGALPGERVLAHVVKRHRQYDDAVADEILEASPDRIQPHCAHAQICSGCSLQHLSPQQQIEFKQKHLLDNLERIGKVSPQRLLAPLQRDIWGYRRKARLSVRHVDKKGRALVGFREANGRYVAELQHCPVLDVRVGPLLGTLSALVTELDARASIPQIEVAAAERVVLVFRHLHPLSANDRARLRQFGLDHQLDIVLQPAGNDSLVDLDGAAPGVLSYAIDDSLSLEYLPLDFVQVNDSINRAMIVQALDLLEVGGSDRVLDLYCGLGNFTLPLARQAASVFGVEGDAGLIERARANASRCGIANIDYAVADLSLDHGGTAWAQGDYTRMLLDPPRAGAEAVFDYLPGAGVERLVYVSCHPGTLARDTAVLVQRKGYDLIAAGVMDMFPHTAHVESMALFVRR
jgi:23S rRNA (uracil1939-C5)-methyltransferase